MKTLSCGDARLLLSNLLEDVVSAEEAGRLREHLAACAGCRSQAAASFRLDRALTQLAAREHVPVLAARIHGALADRALPATTPTPSRRRMLGWLTGLAAALLLAGTLGWLSLRQGSVASPAPLANLEVVQGTVFVTSADGSKNAAVSGQAVLSGQGVLTIGEHSQAILTYADGTRLELGPDTTVSQLTATMDASARGRVVFREGLLTAGVSRLPEGRPLLVTTPSTEISAADTQFCLSIDPTATLVEVDKGSLQFTRTADGKSLEIREGYYAVAAPAEAEFATRPMVSAATEPGAEQWRLEAPRIDHSVKVRTLQECQAAVGQPHTAVTLDADIDGAGQIVFNIRTDHILIDGNGHTIRNALMAVQSDHIPRHHIEVRNLVIEKAEIGIHLRRDVHVHVHHNTVLGCTSRGLRFENSSGKHGRYFEVHDNHVQGGRQGCIVFQDGCSDGRVYNNTCIDGGYRPQSNSSACLNFDSNIIRVEAYGNRIEGGSYGLALHGENKRGMVGCSMHDNTIVKAKLAGIRIGAVTSRNVLRNNTVRDCPVGILYQQANRVHANLVDGLTIANCALPVQLEGPAGADPKSLTATTRNVDRLVLPGWKGNAPVVKASGDVAEHTVADAGVWAAGAVVIDGPAKVLWSSYAHVVVVDQGKPVPGVQVAAGPFQATTDATGRALLGPFPAVEVTDAGAKFVAQAIRIQAALGNQRADAMFTPDGAAAHVALSLK